MQVSGDQAAPSIQRNEGEIAPFTSGPPSCKSGNYRYGRPRHVVGDIAVLLPGSWLGDEHAETRRLHVRKPCVALLQIRTTPQGSTNRVEVFPLLGLTTNEPESTSADRRAFLALRLASELEGVLIQQECDVADHAQFWRRMQNRERDEPGLLQEMVYDLAEQMHITHVVLADLATAPPAGGQDYVVFTVTELASTKRGTKAVGRRVAKVEIEVPR